MRNVKENIEMCDRNNNAKGVSPHLIPWQSSLFIPLLALTLGVCGCKSSAFAPRTGEYFQATRMGPGVGCYAYALPVMVGGGCIEKGGPLFLVGIIGFLVLNAVYHGIPEHDTSILNANGQFLECSSLDEYYHHKGEEYKKDNV